MPALQFPVMYSFAWIQLSSQWISAEGLRIRSRSLRGGASLLVWAGQGPCRPVQLGWFQLGIGSGSLGPPWSPPLHTRVWAGPYPQPTPVNMSSHGTTWRNLVSLGHGFLIPAPWKSAAPSWQSKEGGPVLGDQFWVQLSLLPFPQTVDTSLSHFRAILLPSFRPPPTSGH